MGDGPPERTNPAADRIREDSPKRVQSHARPGSLETIFFQNGVVKLHAVAAGPNDGSDVISIADQLGQQKIFLAGHDWGAAVAWSAALLQPRRIAKLVVVNVPHPSVMRRYMMTHLRQALRSWYIFFLQLPYVPEALFSAFNFRVGTSALLRSSRPGTFSPDDLIEYRAAWSQPGALTSMMNWYRALFRCRTRFPDRTVHVPTRILWGERDPFLLSDMAH